MSEHLNQTEAADGQSHLTDGLGEDWYGVEIAPKLLELADRCRERGIAMVATVEYAPCERGSTMALPDGTGLAMQMLRLCANAGENVDGYMIALRRFCDANGIDTGTSIFMRNEDEKVTPADAGPVERQVRPASEARGLLAQIEACRREVATWPEWMRATRHAPAWMEGWDD